jgi:alpha-galactosidase
MGRALQLASAEKAIKTGEPVAPIAYSICEWGLHLPFKWGSQAGNLWRTTPDIKPYWLSVLGIYELNVRLYAHASPGHWNDPDMLEVGNGNMNYEENKSHFTLWCMMAAPLILGNDIRKFLLPDGTPDKSNTAFRIVTNKALIAIDQDALGMQCRRIWSNGLQDVLLKPLVGGEIALCCFNKTNDLKHFSVQMQPLAIKPYTELPLARTYSAKELWTNREETVGDVLTCTVPAHGVKVFRIAAIEPELP